jgi:trk system potassium uptake protein TrkA
MRIVIGGEDETAFLLAAALMADHTVHLVCPESAGGPRIDRLEVNAVFGELTSTEALRKASVEKADLFVASSPHDERNLVACVVAKHLGARRTACFLFRPDLRAAIDQSAVFADSVGIDTIIRPAEKLAREILRIITVPGALDVEFFEGGRVQLFKHAIEEGAPITRAPLKDLTLPDDVVLVMARRAGQIFVPRGPSRLQPGDKIMAMGNPSAMDQLLHRYLRASHHGEDPRRATVVGGGDVGMAVALGLEDLGWRVKVIEQRRERCEEIARILNALVLHGSGTDLDLLETERVSEDSVLVAVTSNDERNLLVSLIAKHLGVPRIITRADNPATERLFEKVGVDVTLSAQGAALQAIVRSVTANRRELVAELEHGDAMVLEYDIPADVVPRTLSDLDVPEFTIIGAIVRGNGVIIPKGKDSICGNDRVLVFCIRKHEDEVRDFFEHRLPREHR